MATITAKVRAAQDAELKFTPSGAAILEINAAENHSRKDQSGQWQDTGTTWWRVKVFGKLAETLAEAHISKGTLLLVTGRSETREYEKRDGSRGSSLELIADDVAIIPQAPRPSHFERQKAAREIDGKDAYGRSISSQPGGADDPWSTPGASGAPF